MTLKSMSPCPLLSFDIFQQEAIQQEDWKFGHKCQDLGNDIVKMLLERTHLYLTLIGVVCWKARLLGTVGTRSTECYATGY